MNYQSICTQSIAVVKKAGGFIKSQLGKVKSGDIEEKALNSLVSFVDKEAEKMLVEGLSAIMPEAVFLTEEDTVENQEGEWQWIIDPLDGTTNFLHQLPVFSVSVALRHQEELVVGIVYEINLDECFYAWKNGGAYLNDRPVRVSESGTLEQCLLATGFPYYDYSQMQKYLQAFTYFMEHTRGIRRMGSAAVDLAYVACGRFDGFFEYSLNPWDVAAGILLVREAGGQLCDFCGSDNYLFGKEMVATNTNVHTAIRDQIVKAFQV